MTYQPTKWAQKLDKQDKVRNPRCLNRDMKKYRNKKQDHSTGEQVKFMIHQWCGVDVKLIMSKSIYDLSQVYGTSVMYLGVKVDS